MTHNGSFEQLEACMQTCFCGALRSGPGRTADSRAGERRWEATVRPFFSEKRRTSILSLYKIQPNGPS